MAVTRMTMAEILANPPEADRARLAATTEAEIRQQMIEDGQDPDEILPPGRLVRVPHAAALPKHRRSA